MSKKRQLTLRIITGLLFGYIFWAIFLFTPAIVFSMLLAVILTVILLVEWHNFFSPKDWKFWAVAPWYPILPFALLIYMNHVPAMRPLLFILFLVAFSFDTGAYIVGTLVGKHKIAPTISPGKSWEGALGGYVSASIAILLTTNNYFADNPWIWSTKIMLLTGIICLLLLAGDLFESWLKRRAHIKDSSDLLPGHGGFLDRFDGILFAASVLFLAYHLMAYVS